MTDPASSSTEAHQETIPAETNPPSTQTPNAYSKPAPQDIAAANVRQDPIQSLENLASSGRPLAELLEDAKQLLDASNAESNATARGKSEINEEVRQAEIEQERSSGRLNRRAEIAGRSRRSGHLTQIWRRVRLQVLAAFGAAIIGYAFGHVVAGNDRAMRLFFAAAVAMGLFLVFSAFAAQLSRRRWRLY